MVTITQFTPRAWSKTLKRIDWMIAFTVSNRPTTSTTHTDARAQLTR